MTVEERTEEGTWMMRLHDESQMTVEGSEQG